MSGGAPQGQLPAVLSSDFPVSESGIVLVTATAPESGSW